MRRTPLVLVLLAVALLLPGMAEAQVRNHLYDKFQIGVSGTLMLYGTEIRIDPEGEGDGTTIDAEQVLGLESSNLEPRINARFRMGKRHELEAGWQWADRSSEKVLTDTIFIKDTSFAAGLRIATEFNTSQLFLTYRFAFTAKENTQIGFGVGLGAIFLDEKIEAVAGATSGGADTAIVRYSQEESFPGPTGSLGLYGRFRVGEKWYLEADARALYLKISNIKATVLEMGLAARYYFNNTIAAELGYTGGYYSVTLTRDGDLVDLSGKIKYTANGIRAGMIIVP